MDAKQTAGRILQEALLKTWERVRGQLNNELLIERARREPFDVMQMLTAAVSGQFQELHGDIERILREEGMGDELQFVQIAVAGSNLVGLDREGRIWASYIWTNKRGPLETQWRRIPTSLPKGESK